MYKRQLVDLRSSAGTARIAIHDVLESPVIPRNDNTASEGATDEENAETPVYRLERSLDVFPRAHSLGGDHANIFGADDGESLFTKEISWTVPASNTDNRRVLTAVP